ncbi:hypothetical protein V7S43_001004 [Phytophthora oleae]|uniref:Tudor-knot domain-containing protein n=1 Tax=Phytophthora oleae TaxID=2107226 RepID=A0ABD3G5R9_9STRA
MAASLPPTVSSTPATPSDSNPELDSQPTMAPSTVAAATASPAKSGALPSPEKGNVMDAAAPAVEKLASSKSKNRRRRDRNSKPKPKPKRDKAQCVGYYVDALDKKMLWGEARIIQCNLTTQKIKVHFVGWSKNYDLWTDPMSITAHGRYTSRTKDKTVKSWDGDMHVFEDMLGAIEEATFTPVPEPAESQPHITPSSSSAKKKTSKKKKMPSEQKTTKRSTAKPEPEPQRERSHSKRKFAVETQEKATSNARTTANTTEKSRPRQESVRSSKRAAPGVKKTKENTEEKEEPLQRSKRQKREEKQSTITAAPTKHSKARPSKKKKALSPSQLPLFRDLELDDGTVLDFSVQREEAQADRDAMKSFIDSCAFIWKKQLALYVQ